MEETPSLVVDSEVFNKMMDDAINLVRQINEKKAISIEEEEFANSFLRYAEELLKLNKS